jgi:hypothetical protein
VVCQSRSLKSIECGALALDNLRMLTKEDQMKPETTCTSNDTTEKREALHCAGVELKRVETGVQRGTWSGATAAKRFWARPLGFDDGDPIGSRAVQVGKGRGGGELL